MFANFRWQGRDAIDRLIYSFGREAREVSQKRSLFPPRSIRAPIELLIDLSVIHKHDAGTGIQRVVRSLRDQLPFAVGPNVSIEHLIVDKFREGYITKLGARPTGDPARLFFGLDFATDSVYRSQRQLHALRSAGTPMWFLVHDILPITHPKWFTAPARLKYRRWMRVCASLADGFICVSPEVASQVTRLMANRYGRHDLPQIITITPGSHLPSQVPRSIEGPPSQAADIDATLFADAVLVVGTLEPRKGHADVLAAFELLWRTGHAIRLVLIGRAGWNTKALQKTIRRHKQYNHLLFWLDDVSDETLHAAYRNCRLTLVPSLAEGYGLPLDEAVALGSPVLARDLAVFRRHQWDRISYFPEQADAQTLAEAIVEAISARRSEQLPPSLPDWTTAARQITQALGCATETPGRA